MNLFRNGLVWVRYSMATAYEPIDYNTYHKYLSTMTLTPLDSSAFIISNGNWQIGISMCAGIRSYDR